MTGEMMATSMQTMARRVACSEMVLQASFHASSSFPSLSFCEIVGTNAAVKAPSAKNERRMLGIAKAVVKAAWSVSVEPQ